MITKLYLRIENETRLKLVGRNEYIYLSSLKVLVVIVDFIYYFIVSHKKKI